MYPILFRLGRLTIHSYGVMLALAFFLSLWLAAKRAGGEGIESERILDLGLVIIVSAIVGSRLLFVLLHIEDYLTNPVEIFMIQRGGLVFYGGLILSLVAGMWFLKKKGMDIWTVADLIAPYIPLGQSIGRIGCLLNGCCYGFPTELPWGITFPHGSPAYSHYGDVSLHPTQIYHSLANFSIFLILIKLRIHRRYRGQILLSYLLFYSLSRFLIEFMRGDSPAVLFGVTLSQIISIIIFFSASILGTVLWKRSRNL